MTSEQPRFPIGLTVVSAVALAILIGLGAWQLQRLKWKEATLAQIAAREAAPVQPIGPVLARAARGDDVSFTRVFADCAPAGPAPALLKMTADNGEWIARALGACRLPGASFDGVVVDRGFVAASRGSPNPPPVVLSSPSHVAGVLFANPAPPVAGLAHPAPYLLVAAAETPPPPGVTPAPYAADASERLQYVGAYAPTWFGLAGVLACVYAAMLWRRLRPKA